MPVMPPEKGVHGGIRILRETNKYSAFCHKALETSHYDLRFNSETASPDRDELPRRRRKGEPVDTQ
jgi:hypothetical protein